MWRFGGLLAVLLVAGCAEVEKQPDAAAPLDSASEKPSTASTSPTFKSDTLKYLAKRRITPQPTRPLNAKANCSHRDAIGTATRLDLLVKEAEVKTFNAQVAIKGYGTCSFKLGDFDQAATMPQALLRHKRETDCTVRMWEQEQKITIAFNSCPKSCEGDAFSYLWPIMVEAKSGRCF
ncbi:MAG: hypothetical protein Q8S26_05285 [Azonexus sp.]|nr:hypothetical protein [Azonexus sp.]